MPQSHLYSSLPKSPGVYFFKDRQNNLLYVGKAKNLKERVSSYFLIKNLSPKTTLLVSQIASIDYIEALSDLDALILEANLIRRFQPKYNIDLKDGKQYPLIEISYNDSIPLVRIVRKESNKKNRYFGPFPAGADLLKLIKLVRKIFPFVSQKHINNHVCFRSHLSLCPCKEIFEKSDGLFRYKQNLKLLCDFLDGKREDVQKKLRKVMCQAAKDLDFVKAGEVKKILDKIDWLTQPRISTFEYETNPTILSEKQTEALNSIQKHLELTSIPKRIECYDISNTSGKLSVSSMVVAINGQINKSEYKRFRITTKNTPDDSHMIYETLLRRLRYLHDWGTPNLIIVDGGIAQLSKAKQALEFTKVNIPIIALAKRQEEIYTINMGVLSLPKNDPGLQLLQILRDEAHRFSRVYHFLLRKKHLFNTHDKK